MFRFVMFLSLVALGLVASGCGGETVEAVSVPGAEAESEATGEGDSESGGDAGETVATGGQGLAGVPEFYEEYRMAADPLFQAAPDLVGSTYAFSWLDHENEILVVLATELVPDNVRASLAELIPPELPIEYRIVENSAAELDATHQVLSQKSDMIGPVTGFGTVAIENVVQVRTGDVEVTTATLLELGIDLLTVDIQPSTGVPVGEAIVGRTGPIVVADFSDGVEDALVGGTTTWSGDPDECITAGGVETEGVVWPAGTSWDDSTKEIVLPNGDRLAMGDPFTFGGGWHGTDATPAEPGRGWGLTQPVLDAAEDCGWTEFQYVQNIG